MSCICADYQVVGYGGDQGTGRSCDGDGVKITSFQIKNYKVIDDTGTVKVDPRVTALVGKNESGKTAIMKAMWKSRNVASARFDKLYDYPRDRYINDRMGTQEVSVLEFELSEQDADELVEQLPQPPTKKPTKIVFSTFYQGKDDVRYEVSFDQGLGDVLTGKEAAAAIEAVSNALALHGPGDVEAVQQAALTSMEQIKTDALLWDGPTVTALDSFDTAVTNWVQADEARMAVASDERSALDTVIAQAKQGDPNALARAWSEQNLPTFIYFDDYGQLETLIHLPSYLSRRDQPDAKTRTQTALFEWSGLEPEEILQLGRPRGDNETEGEVQRRLEERRVLLKSASFSLTGDWVNWWTGEEHKLEFDVDGDYLVLQVSDAHNPFPISFEERSHGFQWFFSFYLVFLVESKKAHKDAILLLDEPGLHLHPTLQEKLIGFFERISEGNQLLYSTHLPFLVDGNHFERVRTVYLAGEAPQKTVVSDDVRPTGDRDTLFPLQAALGYSIAQTLFMGKRTLVVEGITDYWIMKALDGRLAALNDGGTLHEDTVLIPAGGTARLMPLASIMLASMSHAEGRMLVVVDSDNQGKQAAKRLEQTFGDEAPVVMLGTPLGLEEATIEDLVPRDDYVDAVKKSSGKSFTLNAGEKSAPTNVKAMEMLFQRKNWGNFGTAEKAAAALSLVYEWGKDGSSVSDTTLDSARKLFRAINEQFEHALPT